MPAPGHPPPAPTDPLAAPVDHFLQAHPDLAGAWYPALARVAGRAVTLPGLRTWRPVARRVHAVAQPAGRATVRAAPPVRPPADPGPAAGLTVLSANLWHDWPRQHRWPQRLEAVARLVEAEHVDVLLLQEVARTRGLAADGWLADRLGLALAYARGNGDLAAIGFEEGLAVLARYPIGQVHLRQLGRTRNPLVRRIALGVDLVTPYGPVLAVSAHLGLRRRHNDRQLAVLRDWVGGLAEGRVAVVGGDLNAPEQRAGIAALRAAWTDTYRHVHPQAEAHTHVSHAPWGRLVGPRRLDYVFVAQPAGPPWRVLTADHLHDPDAPHSDHRAVLARLRP